MLRAACCVLQVACCVLRATCCVLRAASRVLQVVCCVLRAAQVVETTEELSAVLSTLIPGDWVQATHARTHTHAHAHTRTRTRTHTHIHARARSHARAVRERRGKEVDGRRQVRFELRDDEEQECSVEVQLGAQGLGPQELKATASSCSL